MRVKKIGLVILVVALVFAVRAGAVAYLEYNGVDTMEFQKSDEAVRNPYSGAYVQMGTSASERTWLAEYMETHEDVHLWFMAFDMKEYVSEESLPEEKLEELKAAFETAEELGVGVIFRAAYDFSGEYTEPELATILSHIEQLAPILNEHKLALLGVQAGMIGPYGEWHSSRYIDDEASLDSRMTVLGKWLDALDSDIFVSLRRQSFIREASEYGISTERLGIYNDGMFASDSDLGTYTGDYDREAELRWSEENLRTPFNGGEMPFVTEYTEIANVVSEAGRLNLSYLNREYNVEVWESWDGQTYDGMSGSDYLCKYLGSRLSATELTTNRHIEKRKHISVKLTLSNDGFAMVEDSLNAYLILECGGEQTMTEADFTMTGKTDGTISATVENPFRIGLFGDSSDAELHIGVKIARTADAPEAYCIRLANEDMEYSDGINWLR